MKRYTKMIEIFHGLTPLWESGDCRFTVARTGYLSRDLSNSLVIYSDPPGETSGEQGLLAVYII